MQREYLRHYWLIWTTKTYECQQDFPRANQRESQENILNILNMLRAADDNQLEPLDTNLQFSSLLKEFPFYEFDQNLYKNNRSQLIESIDKFNEHSYPINLFEIFQISSNSLFFNENETEIFSNLLANFEQLDTINDFPFVFQHNLNLINIEKDQFNSLIEQTVKIEEILIQYP
ncbi:unnamed protein product [Rotaria sp. Silwood1]|nr:unnamed protein product [Rotaria sp. Silwood1]CAF3660071.1 unnamed protein product [Rotaria sp. Silwood1]